MCEWINIRKQHPPRSGFYFCKVNWPDGGTTRHVLEMLILNGKPALCSSTLNYTEMRKVSVTWLKEKDHV